MVAKIQAVRVGVVCGAARAMDVLVMEALQAVLQHGAVRFLEEVGAHLNDPLGRYAQEQLIEGSVVNLAEGESVRHHRIPRGILVGDDVRRIQ